MKVLRYALRQRVYLLAVAIYLLLAALIVIPKVDQRLVSDKVHSQLVALLKSNPPAAPSSPVITGKPVQLAIDRLGIYFPVALGYFNPASSTWTLSSTHVFVDAETNPDPLVSSSNSSLIVFYGHNFNNVLGKTTELVPGDILSVSTANGYLFRYYFVKSQAVAPDDTSVLMTNHGYPLELITCTGLWDQSRRVMFFSLLGQPVKLALKGASNA